MTRENQIKFEKMLLSSFEKISLEYLFEYTPIHSGSATYINGEANVHYLIMTLTQCHRVLVKKLKYPFPKHYTKRALKKYYKNGYYYLTNDKYCDIITILNKREENKK